MFDPWSQSLPWVHQDRELHPNGTLHRLLPDFLCCLRLSSCLLVLLLSKGWLLVESRRPLLCGYNWVLKWSSRCSLEQV